MPDLYGTHHGSADEKGRVMLPVELKNQLGNAVKKIFFIKQSIFHKALELFTEESWKKFSKDTTKADAFTRKGMDFKIMFTNGVRKLRLDDTYRFNIPVELFDSAGIKKEVVMTAIHDRILIWDRKTYEKYLADMLPQFESITEEVMGKIREGKSDGK